MSIGDNSRAMVVYQPPAPAPAPVPVPAPAPAPAAAIELPPYEELLDYDVQQIKDTITPIVMAHPT